jgi:hypothetical protein
MVLESEVSSSNPDRRDYYQNKWHPTHIPHVRPTGAAHDGEC